MPVASPWITRDSASCCMPLLSTASTNSAVPAHTSMCVRSPAALPETSRCKPMTPPASNAAKRRTTTRTVSRASGNDVDSSSRSISMAAD